jgi:hypothetical protein
LNHGKSKKGGKMTQHIYMTGEKPGEGTYRCLNCGIIVVISYHSDLLSNCPTCFGMEFCTVEKED